MAATTAEVIPMTYHASHWGINVLRYFSDPINIKREADPAKEIPSAIRTLPAIDIIKSFLRRFFKAASCLLTYSLRAAFNSLKNTLINSLKDIDI